MRAQHAAALALVGWYLMVPPLDLGWRHATGYLSNTTVPLIRWDIVQSFESVSDCERAREVLFKQFQAGIEHKPAPGLPLTTAVFLASRVYTLLRAEDARNGDPALQDRLANDKARKDVLADLATSPRCIATTDPRLKGEQ